MISLHALVAVGGVDVSGIWQAIQDWMGHYDKAFPRLADICRTARTPFMSIAALMLLCAYGMRFIRARVIEHQVLHVVSAMVMVTMVCVSPQLLLKVSQGFQELATEMAPNVTLDGLNKQVDGMLADYLGVKAAKSGSTSQDGSDLQAGQREGDWGWFQFLNPDAIGQKFDEGWATVQALAIQFFQGAVTFFFKACLFVAMCFELFQYFYLQVSSIFLPAFIAMIALSGLSAIGIRYLMGLIGVCAWPLAWGLSNVGTSIAVNAITANVGDPSKGPMEYIWIGILICAVPAWIAVTYAFGPFYIQRSVAHGGNAVGGMVAAAAGTTAGLAAAGAGVITSGAAAVVGGVGNAVNAASRGLAGILGASSGSDGSTGSPGPRPTGGGGGSPAAGGGSGGSGSGPYAWVMEAARQGAEQTIASYQAAARATGSLADELASAEGMPGHGLRMSEIMAARSVEQWRNQRKQS